MAVNFIKVEDIQSKIKQNGFTLVNFFADWCGPCKMIAPVLNEISQEYNVYKVNIDENKGVLEKENIGGVPHTRIYKDGKLVDEISGYAPAEKITAMIASA